MHCDFHDTYGRSLYSQYLVFEKLIPGADIVDLIFHIFTNGQTEIIHSRYAKLFIRHHNTPQFSYIIRMLSV